MSDEQDKLKLSLEPPKLFGRKKKPAAPSEPAQPVQPSRPAAAQPAPAPDPTPEPAAVVEPAPEVEATVEVVEEPTVVLEAVEEPAPEPEPAAVVEPEPAPDVEPEPQPVIEPEPEPVIEPEPEPTAVIEPDPEPVAKPDPRPAAAPRPAPKPAPQPVEVIPEPVDEAALEDAEIATLSASGPLLTAYRAAAVTGLVVGAGMVVLTWLSLRGCEAVRGTSSCGGGPGFLLLVATFAVCVLLGSQLLKAFQIPDPGSSSFLAVGLVAVVALLFLIDSLDHWSMLIVIPILSIGGYLASVWVTKTFVEPVDT